MTKKDKVTQSRLSPGAILRVMSAETKERCTLDIIAAIQLLQEEGSKEEPTVKNVIALASQVHKAPRSLIAKDPKKMPGFVMGYLTNAISKGMIEVAEETA